MSLIDSDGSALSNRAQSSSLDQDTVNAVQDRMDLWRGEQIACISFAESELCHRICTGMRSVSRCCSLVESIMDLRSQLVHDKLRLMMYITLQTARKTIRYDTIRRLELNTVYLYYRMGGSYISTTSDTDLRLYRQYTTCLISGATVPVQSHKFEVTST